MPTFHQLSPELKPLADRFYQSQRSAMRTRCGHRVWVAQQEEIVAALCLQNLAQGQWLTSLLVAAEWRHQGLASNLIEHALHEAATPAWLFCHPDLQAFYQRLGFQPCERLPAALTERLARYRRKKSLIAMQR